jgi:hypothetical protein
MKQLYLILLLFLSLNIYAQNRSTILSGEVISDSLSVENIHIFNKTSKKGTISNQKGEFEIEVKLNDTLLFSGIQFYLFEINITQEILERKYIEIDLLQKINTLDEVELNTHNLFGNLTIDSKNFMDTLQKANSLALNFGDIDFSVPSKFVAKQLEPNKLPDTNPTTPIGGDLLGLALFVFKPVIKEVSKIGKNKRELKRKERNYQINSKEAPEKIREEFGDQFFISKLNIPIERIDAFIIYCKSKGIIDLFLQNKKIEMIDLFIKESKSFKNN